MIVATVRRSIASLSRDEQLRDIARQAPASFGVKAAGGACAYAFGIAVARMVGAEAAGIYYLAFTVLTVGAVIAAFGFDTTSMRFAGALAGEGDWSRLAATYRAICRIVAFAAAGVAAVVFVAAGAIARDLFHAPSLATPLRLASIAILPLALASVHVGLLRSARRQATASAVESLWVPAVGLAVLIVLHGRGGVNGVTLSIVLGAFAAAAFAVRGWRHAVPQELDPLVIVRRADLIAVSAPVLGIAVMNLVLQFADSTMLGLFGSKAAVGVYAAALRTATLANLVLSAVSGVVIPRFAHQWASRDRAGVERLARRSAAIMTGLSAPLLLVLFVWPERVLALFGPNFRGGAVALRILVIGQVAQTVTGAVGYLMVMVGQERALRNLSAGAAAFFVATNWILIPRLGMNGAAISFAVTLVLVNSAKAFVVWRRAGIRVLPSLRARERD